MASSHTVEPVAKSYTLYGCIEKQNSHDAAALGPIPADRHGSYVGLRTEARSSYQRIKVLKPELQTSDVLAFVVNFTPQGFLSRVRRIKCTGQDGHLVSCLRRWTNLQESLELQLVRDNGQIEQGTWSYEASGDNRMVYRLQNSSQGLVAKLNPHVEEKNHNREECKIYETIGNLGGLMPRCYSVATCSIGGQKYDIMILDRVAFTVEALLQQQHQEPPNKRTVGLVVFVICKVVDAAAIVSGPEYKIECTDWHSQNLAIASVTDGEVSEVSLMDWVGHAKAPHKRIRYQYFEHHILTEVFPEVVFTGLLFKILLEEIENAGLHDRIDRNQRGEVGKVARDGNNFHGQQGECFMLRCRLPWTEMSSSQRLRALRYYMWQKFSIDKDKRRKVM